MSSSNDQSGTEGAEGAQVYGVIELDSTLKSTVTSLEEAMQALTNLVAIDLDHTIPGLAAFQEETQNMIGLLSGVCSKVEGALNVRRNESQMMVNTDLSSITSSSSQTSVGSSDSYLSDETSVSPTLELVTCEPPPPPPCPTVVYDFELKLTLKK